MKAGRWTDGAAAYGVLCFVAGAACAINAGWWGAAALGLGALGSAMLGFAVHHDKMGTPDPGKD